VLNKNKVVLKKVILIRVIQIVVYCIFLSIGFWAQVSYYHGKNVVLDFLIIAVIYDLWTKILTPVFNCPRYVIFDFDNKTITIKWLFGKKKEIILSEIKRIVLEWEEIKSLTREPNTTLFLYLKNREKIKICLMGLKVVSKEPVKWYFVGILPFFISFFGELLKKNNKDAMIKIVEEALVYSKGTKDKLFMMCFSKKILTELGMKLEDYAKELELYDYLPWEKYYALKEGGKDCLEELILREKKK